MKVEKSILYHACNGKAFKKEESAIKENQKYFLILSKKFPKTFTRGIVAALFFPTYDEYRCEFLTMLKGSKKNIINHLMENYGKKYAASEIDIAVDFIDLERKFKL